MKTALVSFKIVYFGDSDLRAKIEAIERLSFVSDAMILAKEIVS